MQQRQAGQHPRIESVRLGVLVVVVPQVSRLLGWHQDHRGAVGLEPGRQRHPGVAGRLEDHGHRRTVGDLRPQAFEIGGRRAELPRRPDELTSFIGQAGPVVGPTRDVDAQPHFLHGMVLSLDD